MVLKIIISLAPVFLFLIGLILLDSFKLVKPGFILRILLYGCSAAVICYIIATIIRSLISLEPAVFSNFLSPVFEEIVKASFFYLLLKRNKIGFMVDATIYGFAIGTGFAFIENIYYLNIIESSNLLVWIIRGMGTAVMHGSTTAIFAILMKYFQNKKEGKLFIFAIPAILPSILLHSFYNHFIFSPLTITILQLLILPIIVFFVYNRSEISLKDWMELSLETDINIIRLINSGDFSKTKIGRYLYSLKQKVPEYIVVDMFCYLLIYAELAMKAKGVLMLREAGFRVPKMDEVSEKFQELSHLEKSIGKTGKMALSPILNIRTQELWQLYFLGK